MSTTYIPTNNRENAFTIVTHVIPVQTAPNGVGQNGLQTEAGFFSRPLASNTGQDHSTPGSVRTSATLPTVLGTMQIMTGVMLFLLGIVLSQHSSTQFFTRSLHGYWGSVIYICAGGFSVAAKNKSSISLMKGSLAVNTVSVVTAGIATILLSLDLAYGPDCVILEYNPNSAYYCDIYTVRTNGINGVLLIFSLLQFIVSICMSLFGLDVTCCTETGVCETGQFPFYGECILPHNPFHTNRNEEGVFIISNPNINSSLLTRPPEYSETEPSTSHELHNNI